MFPLNRELISAVLAGLLDGSLSAKAFEDKMFSEIGEPEKFVIMYYERYQGDHTLLEWMRDLGSTTHKGITEFREKLSGAAFPHRLEKPLRQQVASPTLGFAKGMLKAISEEAAEIGLTTEVLLKLAGDQTLLSSIPYFQLLSKVLPTYVLENAGVLKNRAIPFSQRWRRHGSRILHPVL